jgi:hypothetical protein
VLLLCLPGAILARSGLTPAYAALVAQVASGSDADRRTFARIALEQMAAAHEVELARARGADGRWRRFMEREALRLRARADRIDETLRIALAQDGPDGVRLILDGENFIIASPRLDAPERLEAAIVAEACLYLPCRPEGLADAPAGGAPPPAAAGATLADPAAETTGRAPFGPADDPAARTWPRLAVTGVGLAPGRWYRLNDGGATYRTANGLNFQFRAPGGAEDALARLCEAIAADFERLAAALAHATAQRWPLAWDFLRLGPALEGEQSVVINPLGDAFLLPLAEPAILGRLLPAARGWLEARTRGEGTQHYFPEADRLLPLAASPEPAREAPVATAPPGWRPL